MIRSNDCCTGDGVECDENTGHVISLDLSNSFLYGSINSSSSLFQLVHLQKLNLSFNNFNHSEIPIGVRRLSKLTHLDLSYSSLYGSINSSSSLFQLVYLQKLNLSFNNFNHSEIPIGVRRLSKLTQLDLAYSRFSGEIPSEILQLSKLVSLVLYSNPLKLHKPGLRSIAEKLTNLEELVLSEVDISSTVPSTLANLSSLTTIFLRDCGLHGEFPTGIFQLPNLKSLCALKSKTHWSCTRC